MITRSLPCTTLRRFVLWRAPDLLPLLLAPLSRGLLLGSSVRSLHVIRASKHRSAISHSPVSWETTASQPVERRRRWFWKRSKRTMLRKWSITVVEREGYKKNSRFIYLPPASQPARFVVYDDDDSYQESHVEVNVELCRQQCSGSRNEHVKGEGYTGRKQPNLRKANPLTQRPVPLASAKYHAIRFVSVVL